MRWAKSLLRILAAVVVLGAVMLAVAWAMLRGTPSWYPQAEIDPAVRQAAAARAENELQKTIDWAAARQAEERARLHAGTAASTKPSTTPARRALTVRFTEQELNAAFEKWGTAYGWQDKYGDYITDPRIVLYDGKIIFAGLAKTMNTLVSLHFEPRVDERGRLQFDLVGVYGGRLPLPQSAFDGYREKLERRVQDSLPALQQGAKIAPDGSANDKAVAATLARLLLRILDRKPDEAVLFLAANQGTRVPVKLTDVKTEGKSIALTVELLDAAERAALLERIKEPYESAMTNDEARMTKQ